MTAADDKIRDDQKLNERINVLLLGIDDGDSEAAESEPKRTDAIILLSFDPQNNKVAVLSIPRDTMVVLPGHKDPEKINAAFAYGGVVMAKQTVANLLRVPIHYYALANWRGFIDVVNLIGGVDIYVDKDMYTRILMLIWLLISSMAISIWMAKLPVNMCASARMSLVI